MEGAGKCEAAADPWAPPTGRWTCSCDGLPKIDGVYDNHGSLSGHIPRTFDLLALPRESCYPSSSVSHRPAVQSPGFKRIDIAERARAGKFELGDIVVVLEWCARV